MWIYEKKLQFPVKITRPDARMAKIMIEQYGGCDGEWGAAHRYLSQRYSMVTPEAKATLNDIATEELGHAEIMGTIVRQLMQGLTKDQIIEGGLEAYYVNHGFGVYPCSAAGVPFSAAAFQSKGDPITDLYEDMAADAAPLEVYPFRKSGNYRKTSIFSTSKRRQISLCRPQKFQYTVIGTSLDPGIRLPTSI